MRQTSLIFCLVAMGLVSCGGPGRRIEAGTGGTVASGSGSGGNAVVTGSDGANGGIGCAPAMLPAYSALNTIAKLPDPFQSMDGTRITTKTQWACRRAEIAAQAQQYELGPKPDKPSGVSGSLSGNTLTVTVANEGKTISFPATITYPTTGTAPYPAMIGIGGISIGPAQLSAMGVATIIFPNDSIAAQVNASSRGQGLFYNLYTSAHPAGAMIAWAWGVSRLIDALEQTPDARIDSNRLGVTGCSRNGKGALIAGAFDERIALTIPQESGSGGSASWRVSDAQMASGTVVQTLSEITGENTWFTDSFTQFNTTATKLPFDHHMIEAMVAPRALLVIENTSQVWLGNVSTFDDSMAAHLVWEALGIPDKMGVSQIGDHMHCQWNGSQQPEVTAYVQKFLIGGGTADTNVLKTDGNFTFDRAAWVDWDVPALP